MTVSIPALYGLGIAGIIIWLFGFWLGFRAGRAHPKRNAKGQFVSEQ